MDRVVSLTCRLLRWQSPINLCTKRWWNERWRKEYLRDLYNRRVLIGPEQERPRSAWLNWNYDKEVFAFEKRLNEQFNANFLRRAFVHASYVREQQAQIEQLGVSPDKASSASFTENNDNTTLIEEGLKFTTQCVSRCLSGNYPNLPANAIASISEHLTSIPKLACVGSHIGVKDLVLAADFPLQLQTIANTFLALVGALRASPDGEQRAERFVRDLLVTQLVGADLNSLYRIDDPLRTLAQLAEHKLGYTAVESRLIWQSAVNTVLSCYVVGIYATRDKSRDLNGEWTLIGESAGETVQIAEEEAARNALRRFYGTLDSQLPIDFSLSNAPGATTASTAADDVKRAKAANQ